MSLYNSDKNAFTGKVLLGTNISSISEMSVAEISSSKQARWEATLESDFFERIKAKAAEKAKEIVVNAQHEAKNIRDGAHHQGYEEGLKQANQELETMRQHMAEALAQALASIQEGAEQIWENNRQDLVMLTRLAVEKITRIVLDKEREQVMAGLLDQALDALDSHKVLYIKINPDDEALVSELLARAKDSHPTLEKWRLKPDPGMHQGGLVVESDYGMADNSLENRYAIVSGILDQLTLPFAQEQEG